MSDFIVDASVVAKWLVEEPDSGRARSLKAKCRLVTADERFVRSIQSDALRTYIVSLNDGGKR